MARPKRIQSLMITLLIFAPLTAMAGIKSQPINPENCGSLELVECIGKNHRDTLSFPFAVAVMAMGIEIDKVTLLGRRSDNGSKFTSFASNGNNIAANKGTLWEINASEVALRLADSSLSQIEAGGFELRLRLHKSGGAKKACPAIKFRKSGGWEFYDSNKKKWRSMESGTTFTAMQAAIKIPTKGLQCQ